ncbi:hypothetical protein BD560DRAFT_444669 [Blakeslea trispora]|nr:hypothetical protein BD560DRAFT_444669 [Blakeslea trispora]
MTRSNPFFRRASSPGDIRYENQKENSSVSTPSTLSNPSKLAQASLSDSALKVPHFRPDTLRNTQPRTVSIRPSRFIKVAIPTASFSSPIMPVNDAGRTSTSLSLEMSAFVQLFEMFTQKIYMEGYLMRHNNSHDKNHSKKKRTKIFAEISGSTLILWDTELPGTTIMPTYFQITDKVFVHSVPFTDDVTNKKRHVFTIQNNKISATFETSDEASMLRWVCAVRLCSFEKQSLHKLFTHRLLLPHEFVPTDVVKQGVFLQVKLPDNNIWQKCWVVLNESSPSAVQKSKRFGRKSSYTSQECQQSISLFENKKSKTPTFSFSSIKQAYAVYPESSQLIEKGSMVRIFGTLDKTQELVECWFMAGDNQTTIKWLLAIYDLFELYGRPHALLKDSSDSKSLNFGELHHYNDHFSTGSALLLQTNDVLQTMNTASISSDEIESSFIEIVTKKMEQQKQQEHLKPANGRANSLPLITIVTPPEVDEHERIEELKEEKGNSFQFSRQIADSSDESSDGEDDNDDDEDIANERESDDELARRKSLEHKNASNEDESILSFSSNKSSANELIPDFDFGNGFDVPRSVMAAAAAANISASQTLPTRGSHQRRSRHRSSMALFNDPSISFEGDSEEYPAHHKRKSSMPTQSVASKDGFSDLYHSTLSSSSASSSCTPPPHLTTGEPSLFGDFNLGLEGTGGDFSKFLQEPLDYHRKFSLTFSSTEMTSPSISSSHHSHEWDDLEDHDVMHKSPQHPYMDDNSSFNEVSGPMIPPLGDHFAPQNSLLDTYLGDQLSAKEQIEYAKATGQPLIQVSTKKESGLPKGGLVGVISQREKDRKEGTGYRVAERVNQHHAQQDRFGKEKERRLLEQRQQQFMKHQMLLYANGFNMPSMGMMGPHNYMNPMMGPASLQNNMMPMNVAMFQAPHYNPSLPSNPYNLPPACMQMNQNMPPNRNMSNRPFFGPSPPPCPPTGYYGSSFVPSFNLPSPIFSQGRKSSHSTLDSTEELLPGQKSPVHLRSSASSTHVD